MLTTCLSITPTFTLLFVFFVAVHCYTLVMSRAVPSCKKLFVKSIISSANSRSSHFVKLGLILSKNICRIRFITSQMLTLYLNPCEFTRKDIEITLDLRCKFQCLSLMPCTILSQNLFSRIVSIMLIAFINSQDMICFWSVISNTFQNWTHNFFSAVVRN